MTTDLEKQFFDTFGIKEKYASHYDELYPDFKHYTMDYPKITDRILLELICILSNVVMFVVLPYNIEQLRENILKYCIKYSDDIKHQVQALFKEER